MFRKHSKPTSTQVDLDWFTSRTKRNLENYPYIDFRKLTDDEFDQVCSLLPHYQSFHTLALTKCLSAKRLIKLTAALTSKDRQLSNLLINFGINNANITHLIELLVKNPSIKTLCLNHCNLDIIALELLSDYIKKTDQLIEIELLDCEIDDIGAEMLRAALYTNRSIKKVSLARNQIADPIKESLQQDSSIIANINFSYIVHSSAMGSGLTC